MASAKGRALGAAGVLFPLASEFRIARSHPWACLFWGAGYWLPRQQHGDPGHLEAFARVLDRARGDGC